MLNKSLSTTSYKKYVRINKDNSFSKKRIIIAAILIIVILLAYSFFLKKDRGTHTPEHATAEPVIYPDEDEDDKRSETYKVINVVDGDTIDIDVGGKKQRIRLIGVNTPETVHPEKTVECFCKEATIYTKTRLLGKDVSIEIDESQDRFDKYNRLLAYIFIGSENFNLELIKHGYAYEYTYNVPYKYQKLFKDAQRYAEKNKEGLWAPDACKNNI